MRHRNLHKKKSLYADKHNFNPDKGKEDHTNADEQNMDIHNTDFIATYCHFVTTNKNKGILYRINVEVEEFSIQWLL